MKTTLRELIEMLTRLACEAPESTDLPVFVNGGDSIKRVEIISSSRDSVALIVTIDTL